VRGLLIINPQATTTSGDSADLVIRELGGLVDLEVVHTDYRGHARDLAAEARSELVIVVGGDGAVNEAVNGLMGQRRGQPAGAEAAGAAAPGAAAPGAAAPGAAGSGAAVPGPAGSGAAESGAAGYGDRALAGEEPGDEPPLLAVIPGGGANVFARALGLPPDPVAAVSRIREVIASGRYRTIGLGRAGERYFTTSAGLGLDAESVREVERLRADGHKESPTLFAWAILRRFARTDRRRPALTLEQDGQPPVSGLFMTAITNRSPWTYVRGRAVLPVPNPDFNSGLDVLGLSKLRMTTIFGTVGQMLFIRSRSPRGRHVLTVTGLDWFTVRSARPVAFQVDGDYLGETEAVKFQFISHALRVVA